jgi:hypothetical protein
MPAKSTAQSNTTLTASLADTDYLALFSVAPTASTAGTELSGSGYARAAITWAAAASAARANSAAIDTATATGNWSAAIAFAVMSAVTGGTLKYFGSMTSLSVLTDQFVRIPAAGLVISES